MTPRRVAVAFALGALPALAVVAALLACRPRPEDVAAAGLRPAAESAAAAPATVWFRGDFESGDLGGWSGDLPRPDAVQVVSEPVRHGRYAARISLAPGDLAAHKERTELRLADRSLERSHAGEGTTVWYGWSLYLPEDHADPAGGQYPILAQWHHRPGHPGREGGRAHVTGPPPLALYLLSGSGGQSLVLIGQETVTSPPTRLGERPISLGEWLDLVFQIRWSTGNDGFVAAWIDGEPFTDGRWTGPTLYNSLSNYFRLGFYRGKGGTTTNHVYYDEVWMSDEPPPALR